MLIEALEESGLEAVIALDDYFFAFVKNKSRIIKEMSKFAKENGVAFGESAVRSSNRMSVVKLPPTN
jgi:hypothetical protein